MIRTGQPAAAPPRCSVSGAGLALLALLGAGCSVLAPTDPSTAASGTASGAASAAVSASDGSDFGSGPAAGSPPTTSPAPSGGPPPSGGLEAVPQVAATVQPSVVTVLVQRGNGSGVVYSADGLIVTNEHVVRGSPRVEIAFADGQRVAGTVRAVDVVSDLALVQANRRNLPAATFQTRLPVVGSLAVVLGAPLGFQNTVTAGVISGLHREIPGSAAEGQSLVDLLQTDAPISPGNSGGAVADASGKVIGISEAYIPPQNGAVALGFAIPAATVVDVASQLQRNGRAQHAFAGVVPAAITEEIAQQYGLPSTDGVIISEVSPGGPAGKAGLQPGDVITAAEGRPTRIPEDFLAALRRHRPGDVISLTVSRGGQAQREVRLTLTDRPVETVP